MFVHSVYFWLKDNLSEQDRRKFEEELRSLLTIESVSHGFIGSPAATDRPVVDATYSRALIVFFEDEAGHDAYQEDPIHDRFRVDCEPFWQRILIYDAEA